MDCPMALDRIKAGRPMDVKDGSSNQSKLLVKLVSSLITLTDKLRLDMRAKDQVHTDLKELLEVMEDLKLLPADFEGRDKLKCWVGKLDQMNAADTLSDEECRQLIFDLESSYSSFERLLHQQ